MNDDSKERAVRNINRIRAQDFVSFPVAGMEPLRRVKDLATGEWTDQVRKLTRPALPPLGTEPETEEGSDEF